MTETPKTNHDPEPLTVSFTVDARQFDAAVRLAENASLRLALAVAIDRAEQAEAERDDARADHAGAERRLKVARRNIDIKDQAITECFAAIERVRALKDKWTRQPGMSELADDLDVALTPTEEGSDV